MKFLYKDKQLVLKLERFVKYKFNKMVSILSKNNKTVKKIKRNIIFLVNISLYLYCNFIILPLRLQAVS